MDLSFLSYVLIINVRLECFKLVINEFIIMVSLIFLLISFLKLLLVIIVIQQLVLVKVIFIIIFQHLVMVLCHIKL